MLIFLTLDCAARSSDMYLKGKLKGKLMRHGALSGQLCGFVFLIAAGVAGLSIALAFAFPHFFKIPRDLQHAAQVTVLLCALGVAISLLAGVFGGVLSAISRFDVLSSISVGQTVARAAGVVLILRSGRGLISLAYWEFTVILLTGLATCFSAMKLYPTCRVRLGKPDFITLKKIWAYSFKTFIIIVAVQIVFYTDNLVVGAFLSVGSRDPLFDCRKLGYVFRAGCPGDGIDIHTDGQQPGCSRQIKGFAEVTSAWDSGIPGADATDWFDAAAARQDIYRTLDGTAVQSNFRSDITDSFDQSIFYHCQCHCRADCIRRRQAYDRCNVVCSGSNQQSRVEYRVGEDNLQAFLHGVAWGTSISQAIIHLIFWPRYVKKEIGVPIRRYLWEGWTKITLCSIPFGVACVVADRYWYAGSMVVYFSQILALLPVYALTVMAVFHEEVGNLFQQWKASRSGTPATIA